MSISAASFCSRRLALQCVCLALPMMAQNNKTAQVGFSLPANATTVTFSVTEPNAGATETVCSAPSPCPVTVDYAQTSPDVVTIYKNSSGAVLVTSSRWQITVAGHEAILSWTASISPGVTYRAYRAAASVGPFGAPLNASPISGLVYVDKTVQAGQTYWYVVTAVAMDGSESDYSVAAQATIPSP